MLAVTQTGIGSPLILLHGWGLHSGVWENILPALEKRFSCYAVDMLGHGESQTKSHEKFSLESMREALNELVNNIDSKEITIMGWSLGGLVAIDYLSVFPKKVQKLILVASNACFCKKEDWQTGLELSVLENFAAQLEQDYKKTVDKFMALQMFGADDHKQALRVLKSSMASPTEPSMDALRAGLDILKNTDLTKKLREIKQSVLMITGEDDRLMPYQAANAMQAMFNNAYTEMIKGAGHAPFISHPTQFIEIIDTKLKE